jgi:nucleotide-binding universal stress UspA family protein
MIPFRRILVPHDFSRHATNALRIALDLLPPNGRLVLLHVVTPAVPVTDLTATGIVSYLFPDELVARARRALARVIARSVPPRCRSRVQAKVTVGDPFQRIFAETPGADLIVMSTAGRTGLSHLLIGSVAEKVVRHSPVPVLTVRPRGARRRRAMSARPS